jgi:hypothetical protein
VTAAEWRTLRILLRAYARAGPLRQNLRIEEAKRLLEDEGRAADEIAALVGYDNPAFFRRISSSLQGVQTHVSFDQWLANAVVGSMFALALVAFALAGLRIEETATAPVPTPPIAATKARRPARGRRGLGRVMFY